MFSQLMGHRLIGGQCMQFQMEQLGEGDEYLGNSLGHCSSENLLVVMKDIMEEFHGMGSWKVQSKRNYMIDVLGYLLQGDAYSCGF